MKPVTKKELIPGVRYVAKIGSKVEFQLDGKTGKIFFKNGDKFGEAFPHDSALFYPIK